MRTWTAIIAIVILPGCAVGSQHSYSRTFPYLGVEGSHSVAVATQDARPYVLSKEKTPDFVGIQRGGFGNPFDVTTASGKPLADDFSQTVAQALQHGGYKSSVAAVPLAQALPDVRALAGQNQRLALITLHEWKSDTYQNTALVYEVTLRIFDGDGVELATNRIGGKDNLGGSAFNPPSHARIAVPAAYLRKLSELFDTDAVVRSLR